MSSTYLVERYWPGVTEQAYAATVAQLETATGDLRRRGVDVRLVDSLFMAGDEAVMYRIAATTAADVERACRSAGLPFERITEYVEANQTTSNKPTQGTSNG